MKTAGDRVDLHAHTDYSDGDLSPEGLAEMAVGAGLRALAVTDHDTMEGLAGLTPPPGLELVPGVERKADWEGIEIHVLGYDGDWEILRAFPHVEKDRNERNAAIVEKLRADGVDISLEELYARKKGVVGRPHIAALLAEKGYFPDLRAAFDGWLGEGAPYYVPITRQTVPEVAGELRAAGAKVVLAHPFQYTRDGERLRRLARLCADSGFHGMEVYYSGYTAADSALLRRLAESLDLCVTGGSDYHGAKRPERVLGQPEVPYALLAALREKEKP
ncbi:MAG: PHP domain-containing protein [Oscillospiraceae bacterium]|nr:PHP domain-containing protein [Oscillospiraceae bacterium]